MTSLLPACEGLEVWTRAWDVILAVGHCLTGILHATLKNCKNVVSRLQLIPPELFPPGGTTHGLWLHRRAFLIFQWKLMMEKKRRDEGNSCPVELTSEQLSWETGPWASPTVLADTGGLQVCLVCMLPQPCTCPPWRWVLGKADPRAAIPEGKTVLNQLWWKPGVFCWKQPLGVRNFTKETVFHIK